MATTSSEARSNEAKTRAEASFKKEERAREGAKAMSEYQASGREVREQMARLKALRLAKEAQAAQAELEAPEPNDKARKPAAKRKPGKTSPKI